MLNAEILDRKRELESTCYLCKTNLAFYMESIPENYREFDIQRGIVNNTYLDKLVDTVLEEKHIPPLVIVTNSEVDIHASKITVRDYKILDGLQRTHRLKIIWETLMLIKNKELTSLGLSELNLLRHFKDDIKEIGVSTKVFKKVLSYCLERGIEEAENLFSKNILWLEVWDGLTDERQVEKMLLLNAGHKSVNIKHQVELLFLNLIPKFHEFEEKYSIEFFREKDLSAIQYSKSRKTKQYHFAHIVSSLVSMSEGKAVTTNADFVNLMQSENTKYFDLTDEIDLGLMEKFICVLIELDIKLSERYQQNGIRWLGREVVLVGLFGAIGSYAREKSFDLFQALDHFYREIENFVNVLDIDNFEYHRNKVELAKVNIGNINKKAVYNFSLNFLHDELNQNGDIWAAYFPEVK